jgi:hypothetical protein
MLLACSIGASGCSFVWLRRPPETLADPTLPVTSCSDAPMAPVVDAAIVVAYAVLLGVAISRDEATTKTYLGTGLLGGTFAASSIYGFQTGSRCGDLMVLNLRCRRGDQEACRTLTPVTTPGRPAAPLLCARDRDCATGQRCLEAACVETPTPDAPGEAGPTGRSGP